jgi:hypothetical protein
MWYSDMTEIALHVIVDAVRMNGMAVTLVSLKSGSTATAVSALAVALET